MTNTRDKLEPCEWCEGTGILDGLPCGDCNGTGLFDYVANDQAIEDLLTPKAGNDDHN